MENHDSSVYHPHKASQPTNLPRNFRGYFEYIFYRIAPLSTLPLRSRQRQGRYAAELKPLGRPERLPPGIPCDPAIYAAPLLIRISDMHRIDGPGHLHNRFADGNARKGHEGTVVKAAWLNAVQEELINVIEVAGLSPNKNDDTQLLQAIRALIPQTVATFDDLRAGPASETFVHLLGFHTPGDGGEGTFFRRNDTAVESDGFLVVQDARGRYWQRQTGGAPLSLLWFGARRDGKADSTAAIDAWLAAIKNGEGYVPPGTYLTSGGHQLSGQRLIGSGMSNSLFLLTKGAKWGFKIGHRNAPGTGMRDLGIRCAAAAESSGILLETCTHVRLENIEVVDAENGFYFLNSRNKWTESNMLIGVRSTRCRYGYRFGQDLARPGTTSFGYQNIIGTASEMPAGGRGIWVEAHPKVPPVLYGSFIRLNIYMNTALNSIGCDVEGKITESTLILTGETPGGGQHTAVRLGPRAWFMQNSGHLSFENGGVDVVAGAKVRGNQLKLSLTGRDFNLTSTIAPEPSAK